MSVSGEESLSKSIFINNVDSFHSKNIAKYLSNCVVGASLEEVEEAEEGEEEGGEANEIFSSPKQKENCYEVYATVKSQSAPKPEFVKEIWKFETREDFYEHLVECDIIIYDISDDPEQIDEAVWAVSAMNADADKLEGQKTFILVTSLMTWAKTKPVDPEDPEVPFTEEDNQRRKPHPNFKEHLSAEKTIFKLGKKHKSKLATYIVATGVCYGGGEFKLHHFFKSAWHNAPFLTVFGNGDNIVPTIHIRDLAGVIQNIADSRPRTRYIVAKDEAHNTLREIIKAISKQLTTGKVKKATKEEAALQKEIDQATLEQLQTHLKIDAATIKEEMHIRWAAETGLVEYIEAVVKEYREARQLLPIKVCVLGPPAVGKTLLVQKLCEHYKLHHVAVKNVIDGAVAALELAIRAGSGSGGAGGNEGEDGGEAEGDEQEEEEDSGTKAADLLDAITDNKAENDGRLDNQYVTRFFKEKLLSKPCQNQGFIIDGYPKTKENAEDLFQPEEPDENPKRPSYHPLVTPQYVIVLEAPDQFLRQRILSLPEAAVAGTHNTEEGFQRRLAAYRSANEELEESEQDTVLTYFDLREIHPIRIDVSKVPGKTDDERMSAILERVLKLLGKERNYGPSEDEMAVLEQQATEAKIRQEAQAKLDRERTVAEEMATRTQHQMEWSKRLELIRQQQYELLEGQALPLRHYLMQHVMPVLTEGLVDCAKVRPVDPIDFVAEYLLQWKP